MDHHHHHFPTPTKKLGVLYWLAGIASVFWLLARSGTNPKRLNYPCQRAALLNSLGFLGYLASLTGAATLYRRLRRQTQPVTVVGFVLLLALTVILPGSSTPPATMAGPYLPAWTSTTAVSDVFAVSNVPVPQCSLDGGVVSGPSICDDPVYAFSDIGVSELVNMMEARGTYFYKTTAHPTGIVGSNDVVVIKINNQWAYNGTPRGRLCTNGDALKGLIQKILRHPESFTGEIVVAENTQGEVYDWDVTPANAQHTNQSYQDVIDAFQGLGYSVSLFRWDDLNDSRISGGNVSGPGYPTGEYAGGNTDNAYILLEDGAGDATNELSYPKFQTTGGISVSMRYGVWTGSAYDSDRLTLINMPVLKQHGMAGATIAWKNFIGFITNSDNEGRFEGWGAMHGYFWGYQDVGDDTTYGLLGRQLALVRAPDLNIVDAIWVADNNYNGTATRQDILLASTDPFAVDWYASEYILYAIYNEQSASAARDGTFRSATRVNQNSAVAVWPGGNYPYMDLLDDYDSDTPSEDERLQMNVYVSAEPTAVAMRDAPQARSAWPLRLAGALLLIVGVFLIRGFIRRRRSGL